MNYFAGNLQYALQTNGLKQNQLSALLEEKYKIVVSASQISNYVKGKSYCTMEVAFALSDFFDIGLDDFFRRDIRDKPPNGKNRKAPPLSMTDDAEAEYVAGVSKEAAVAANESPPNEKEMKLKVMEMMMRELEKM